MSFLEVNYENAILELLQNIDYETLNGSEIERDYKVPFWEQELINRLDIINGHLPIQALNEALYKLKNFENGKLEQQNEIFMNYLQNGITVKYFEDDKEKSGICYLIDYKNIKNNSFYAINQWTFIENAEKRPDIIIFVNGLPLVLMELKSPSRENTTTSEAYRQIRNYMKDIPSIFIYNVAIVLSDLTISKIGTITSSEDRFMQWKTKDGSYEDTKYANFNVFFEGIFNKERFLDIIKNFCLFSNNGNEKIKIIAGYHQYFAVKKAIIRTKQAKETDRKGGVFWHTQGSGKSLSMVFYAHLLQREIPNATIVVLTDRKDLDNQLYTQFVKCTDFLRETPIQAEDRKHLKELLKGRKISGIIFTTMQKFEEDEETLSERDNIIVMADEAHRGQYGLKEKVENDGKLKIGFARMIRNSLPNATYIGFTGTPISLEDRNTREVFGDYIDIYDMTQAVLDGATKPVYYESRVISLNLDEDILKEIDEEYEYLSSSTDELTIEKSKKELGKMDAILGADETINSLVTDILNHYENNRKNLLTGKAMIVAYSRGIGIKIYNKILELRPEYTGKVNVVMTSSNNDPEEWKTLIGDKKHKEELAIQFKDNESDFKIAIVVDMWLTGFDVPSLATMYIYKPMKSHNLMQAITRVNRVFKEKEGGLVVDYVGIASALKEAMNEYTIRDRKNYGDMDIKAKAYPIFSEKLSFCKDIFVKFDYSKFISGTDLDRATTITNALNYIVEPINEKSKEAFIKTALELKQALSLCSSIVCEEERILAVFFEAVRTAVLKVTFTGEKNKKLSLNEINESINNLLKASIKS
ncbi:MAG: type I restriction endonuclease subunit R, partial [Eubacteriales bacterium]|nr:type I restriction endonuclease subunit R [Eubacteriales bacterium]